MPIKFSDLAKATKSATLDVGDGDTISFRFRHGLVTARLLHDLLSLDEAYMQAASPAQVDESIMGICEQVARLVAEWDLLDADGVSMFPLDAQRLAADIPISLQARILRVCMAEMTTQGEASAPEGSDSLSKPRSGATS